MTFKIETGVPLPRGRHNCSREKEAIRALAKADVGASVLIAPLDRPFAFQQAAWRIGGKGWITSRKEAGGWRVWKVAEPLVRA